MKKIMNRLWTHKTLYLYLLASSPILTTPVVYPEESCAQTDNMNEEHIKKLSSDLCEILQEIENLNRAFLNPNDTRTLKGFFYNESKSQLEKLYILIQNAKKDLNTQLSNPDDIIITRMIEKLEDFHHDAHLKLEQLVPFLDKACNMGMFTQMKQVLCNSQGTRSTISAEDIELMQQLLLKHPCFAQAVTHFMNIKNMLVSFERVGIAKTILLLKKRFA